MSDVTPAIVRSFGTQDSEATVHSTPYDGVSHRRGWGDTGYRVEVVEHDCPACSFDRMARRHDVNAEFPDEVRYWCLNPNCLYYLRDELSYAFKGSYPNRQTDEPAIYEAP